VRTWAIAEIRAAKRPDEEMEIFTRRVRYGRNGHKDGTAEFG